MAVNVPEVQKLHDTDYYVGQKVTVFFNGEASNANAGVSTSNTKILTANTVKGANASRVCILDIERIRYHTSFANGYLAIEFVGGGAAGNSNTKVVSLGGNDGGELDLFMPNNAANATGDINLAIVNAQPNDCATLLITYRKNNANGAFNNVYESTTVTGANGFPSAY